MAFRRFLLTKLELIASTCFSFLGVYFLRTDKKSYGIKFDIIYINYQKFIISVNFNDSS